MPVHLTVSELEPGSGSGSIVEECCLSLKTLGSDAVARAEFKENGSRRLLEGDQIKVFSDVLLNGWSPTELTMESFRNLKLYMVSDMIHFDS